MVDSADCVNLLIKAGLPINAQDQRGNTPAIVACFFNKPQILRSLIDGKADLTIKNKEGKDVAAICEERDVDECQAVLKSAK
jgi:ankyrin repeat protein